MPAASFCLVVLWNEAIKRENFDRKMSLIMKVNSLGLPSLKKKKNPSLLSQQGDGWPISKYLSIVITPLIKLDGIGFNNWNAV